jgi:hypothetical protein
MGTTMKKSIFAFALLIPALGVLACDADDDSGDELMTRGLELDPAACGGSEKIPEGAEMVATSKNTLLVTEQILDQVLGIAGASTTEYTCSCDGAGGGECYPKVVDNQVYCASMGCDKCKLNSTSGSAGLAINRLAAQCGAKIVDDELAKGRGSKVQDWAAEQGFAKPEFSQNGGEALAPDGYGLVVEHIGGRSLVFAVPNKLFDEKTGELLKLVGPPGNPENPPLQAAFGGKVKCYCSAAGSCSFTGDGVCSPAPGQNCDGSCTVSGKGLTAGKTFAPSP